MNIFKFKVNHYKSQVRFCSRTLAKFIAIHLQDCFKLQISESSQHLINLRSCLSEYRLLPSYFLSHILRQKQLASIQVQ